jgi:ectoine hydroxylase-related dioxygenase (phytanoyl-CoA dioxygenase family)
VLTDDQLRYFETFGFVHLRQLFTPVETEQILAAAEAMWAAEAGRPIAAEEDRGVTSFVEDHPDLTRLLVLDDRIYVPMRQLMGEDLIWSGSEGNRGFQPEQRAHHWHADRPGPRELGYLRIKVMLYLDPMRRDEGAFRVIPGSHRSPLHEALDPFQQAHVETDPTFYGLSGDLVPCHAVETDPGDAVIFTQSLFHGVYGKTGPRRYIALKFAARPASDLASLQQWSPYALRPASSFGDSDEPRLQRMVAGLADLREHAAALPYP